MSDYKSDYVLATKRTLFNYCAFTVFEVLDAPEKDQPFLVYTASSHRLRFGWKGFYFKKMEQHSGAFNSASLPENLKSFLDKTQGKDVAITSEAFLEDILPMSNEDRKTCHLKMTKLNFF